MQLTTPQSRVLDLMSEYGNITHRDAAEYACVELYPSMKVSLRTLDFLEKHRFVNAQKFPTHSLYQLTEKGMDWNNGK